MDLEIWQKNLQISLIYLTLVSLLPSRPALTLIFTRSIYPFIWWFSRLKSSCWVISFLSKSYRFPFTFVLCPWLRIRAKFITFLSPGFQGPKCWTLSFAYCPIGLKFLSSFGHANQKAHCVTLPKRSKLPILKQAFYIVFRARPYTFGYFPAIFCVIFLLSKSPAKLALSSKICAVEVRKFTSDSEYILSWIFQAFVWPVRIELRH